MGRWYDVFLINLAAFEMVLFWPSIILDQIARDTYRKWFLHSESTYLLWPMDPTKMPGVLVENSCSSSSAHIHNESLNTMWTRQISTIITSLFSQVILTQSYQVHRTMPKINRGDETFELETHSRSNLCTNWWASLLHWTLTRPEDGNL